MSALTDIFDAIADAIRAKNGSSDTYTPAQMADAIENIPSGGSSWDATTPMKFITSEMHANGTTTKFEMTVADNKVYIVIAIPRTKGNESTDAYYNAYEIYAVSKTLFAPSVMKGIRASSILINQISWDANTGKLSFNTSPNSANVPYTQIIVVEMSAEC